MIKDELLKLITEKRAQVGVVGLGYVGLPLVVEFAGAGFAAVGFEVDQSKADRITPANLTSAISIQKSSGS